MRTSATVLGQFLSMAGAAARSRKAASAILADHDEPPRAADGTRPVPVRAAVALPVLAATAEELQAHEAMLALVTRVSGGRCLWAATEPREAPGARLPHAPEPQRSSA
jgi:hypothetical protein